MELFLRVSFFLVSWLFCVWEYGMGGKWRILLLCDVAAYANPISYKILLNTIFMGEEKPRHKAVSDL